MAEPTWDGEQSGFDDMEYLIEECSFGYDERYDAAVGRNVPQIIFIGTATLQDGKTFPGSKQSYRIGKFDPVDGGARAVHESGEDRQFHYQSGYMNFVRAARRVGAAEVLNQRCNNDPLNLRNADIWVGLKFRLVKDEVGTFKNDEGKTQAYSLLLPTEFLGEVGGPSSGTGSTATSPSTASNGSSGDTDLAKLAKDLADDKLKFLDEAVRVRKVDISDAEKAWAEVNPS